MYMWYGVSLVFISSKKMIRLNQMVLYFRQGDEQTRPGLCNDSGAFQQWCCCEFKSGSCMQKGLGYNILTRSREGGLGDLNKGDRYGYTASHGIGEKGTILKSYC